MTTTPQSHRASLTPLASWVAYTNMHTYTCMGAICIYTSLTPWVACTGNLCDEPRVSYMHTHTHAHARTRTHTRTRACTRTHMHAHTHTCMHAHTHTRACTHAHTCMHTHTHVHARTHVHTRTRAHVHAHAHTCTHTHTHVHAQAIREEQRATREKKRGGEEGTALVDEENHSIEMDETPKHQQPTRSAVNESNGSSDL